MIIRKLIAWFQLKWDALQLKKATSAVDEFAKHADLALKAISAHFVTKALSGFVTNTVLAMEELSRSSERLNITAKAFEELKFAAEQSGVPVETLEGSLKSLHKTALEAKWGVVESAQKFRLLGISTTGLNGQLKNPIQLLEELADRIQNMPNPIKQAWAMDKLFGDEGQILLPLLKQGSAGIEKFREEAQKLGMVWDGAVTKRSKEFYKSLKLSSFALKGFSKTFVDAFIPAVTFALKGFSKEIVLLKNFLSTASGLRVLQILLASLSAALVGFALKVSLAFTPLFLKIAVIGALIAALVLIVEDLWVAFNGGESVFKDLFSWAKGFFKPVEKGVNNLITDIKSFFATLDLGFRGIARLMPDFLKAESLSISADVDSKLPKTLSPVPSNITNRNQNVANNVSVAINVQSNQPPKDIAQEISKKLQEELYKERINAFMGVGQYAG